MPHPDARPYVAKPEATADIDAALTRASANGTCGLLVLTADGKPVNSNTAANWRDAASRSDLAIFAELEDVATRSPAP